MSTKSALSVVAALGLLLVASPVFARPLLSPMLQEAVVQNGLTVPQARQVFRSVLRKTSGAERALVRHTYAERKRLEHTGKSRAVALGKTAASVLWGTATAIATGVAWKTAPAFIVVAELGVVPTVAHGVGAAKAWREHTETVDRAMVGAMEQLLQPEPSARLSPDTQRALGAALRRLTR